MTGVQKIPLLTLLEFQNVSRCYKSGESMIHALDSVDLCIWQGEFVAIMGQSGSGKSTLMNILGCLDKPSSGQYNIGGQDVSTLSSDALAELRRKTFGFVFQRYNLLSTATAAENVEIPAIYAGIPKPKRSERAKLLLKGLGLGDRLYHRPNQLSGGQQQRIAIARSLINDPPIILADEPTGALDTQNGSDVMKLLHQLHSEGRTIILVTHDTHVANNAERIIWLQDGKVMESGKPKSTTDRGQIKIEKSPYSLSLFSLITDYAKSALYSLRANLFRTALTLLGIIIGVAAVVTMLAVGNGSKQKILEEIGTLGTNIVTIYPSGENLRSGVQQLNMADADALMHLPNIDIVDPERSENTTLRYGNVDYKANIKGVGPKFASLRNWQIVRGEFFTERDMSNYTPVTVLGLSLANILFPDGSNPVGKYILIRNIPFEVIGVLSPKGANSFGISEDNAAFIPVTTSLARLSGQHFIFNITVKVKDIGSIDQTQEAIKQALTLQHSPDDFTVQNMQDLIKSVTASQNTLTILLGTVAAISLLVGGIGVMNIMLVNVTERMREIGVRMATGARRRDILIQFNIEAAVICTLGGVLGVIVGWLAAWIISLFDVRVIYSALPVIAAFTCAFVTGVLFGYLPARKAAWLDPVQALAAN